MQLVVVEGSDSYTHVILVGSLNVAGVQAVELKFLALTAAAKKPALVDMTDVDFVASLGLRMIFEAARTLKREGLPLILLRPSPDVERALHLSAISTVVIISHDEDEARAHAFAS